MSPGEGRASRAARDARPGGSARARRRVLARLALVAMASLAWPAPAAAQEASTYEMAEIVGAAKGFFGEVNEGLARAIETAFAKLGKPNAYVAGGEKAGAYVVGVRYGDGKFFQKRGASGFPVYWTGPSVGFDVGGSPSKVFALVYGIRSAEDIFQRYPGVEGSGYFVAGVGLNYYSSAPTNLAFIRAGVGLRQGVSAGYVYFTRKRTWAPF
jgi:hypothetical protein